MVMVAHKTPSMRDHLVANTNLPQGSNKKIGIFVRLKDLLSLISAAHNMISRTRIFNSQWSCHAREPIVKPGEVNSYSKIHRLTPFCGWLNYFRVGLGKKLLKELNRWIVRRLRAFRWKQWKLPRTKVGNLKQLGLSHTSAVMLGNTRKGAWRVSRYQSMNYALPAKWFEQHHGLIRLR